MEIMYEIPRKLRFEDIDIGGCFESIKGLACMRIQNCYKATNINDLRNAVELESGELVYFYPGDTVTVLDVTANVRRELFTC